MWPIINKIVHNILLVLSIVAYKTINVCQSSRVTHNQLPLWHWECINEKCVPMKPAEIQKIQSLETCNMLCSTMQIWPQPTGLVSLSTTAVPVRAHLFQLQLVSAPSRVVHEHIQDAFEIFREDLRRLDNNARGFEEWRSVNLRIIVNTSGDPRMRVGTDESYSLTVNSVSGANFALMADIAASTFCGARHALETLLQIVWLDPSKGTLMMLEAVKVEDAPRFAYRGLLIDTARTFIPVDELILNIDAMAASKLNTFHWHISDSQAFSLQSTTVPELSVWGAHTPNDAYSADDVGIVVRRARLRGIRVLIEIDSPAHVGRAWNFGPSSGYGKLVFCVDAEPWHIYCHEPPCGQINPRNQHVYEIFERLMAEIMQLTGVDDIVHIGGSQISELCWLEHFNKTDPMDLWLEHTRSLLEHLQYESKTLPNLTILWWSPISERFKTQLDEYIHHIGLQIRNVPWTQKFVCGIRTIMSNEDAWDLNTGFGAWHEENCGAAYNSWQKVYEHRPWVKLAGGAIEGGEATVWSSVLSKGGLIPRVWPRAAALAERLWTDRPEGATRVIHARLDAHRSRLVARGIQASPIWSMWCTHNPYSCG